jgi:flagellum-specific peptidoglycan hydrolase FlgJ
MSPQQATHHLTRAWEKVAGQEATLEVISVFWAQWALETGRGRWMVDYNYAGLKGVSPDGGWAHWWTWEETPSGPQRVRAKFRNYDSAALGAEDYVSLLLRLYPKAVAAAREGNAAKFIDELVDGGFFTEIPKHYKRSVMSLAAEFRRDTRALRL